MIDRPEVALDQLYREVVLDHHRHPRGRTPLPRVDATAHGLNPVCGDEVRSVFFADNSLEYCATCQTGGKILADRRLSRLLK